MEGLFRFVEKREIKGGIQANLAVHLDGFDTSDFTSRHTLGPPFLHGKRIYNTCSLLQPSHISSSTCAKRRIILVRSQHAAQQFTGGDGPRSSRGRAFCWIKHRLIEEGQEKQRSSQGTRQACHQELTHCKASATEDGSQSRHCVPGAQRAG